MFQYKVFISCLYPSGSIVRGVDEWIIPKNENLMII